VYVALVVNEKVVKTKQTSVKKDTIDPEFCESFHYDMKESELEDASLVLTVWDHNAKSRDDFIGR
jgi:Ca2+-dependent lipid-binding protein